MLVSSLNESKHKLALEISDCSQLQASLVSELAYFPLMCRNSEHLLLLIDSQSKILLKTGNWMLKNIPKDGISFDPASWK